MESDICAENVSPTLVDGTEETVVSDSSLLLENEAEGSEAGECVDNLVSQEATHTDDIKSQHDDDSLNDDQSCDYYEAVSADGSIGGDDVNVNDLDTNNDQSDNFDSSNCGFAASGGRQSSETFTFNDLPFVPKLEFPCQNEDVPNYEALHINKSGLISTNIPRPDKNFTIPPPNYKSLDIKPSLDIIGPVLNPDIKEPASTTIENSTESQKLSKSVTYCSSYSVKALGSVPRSSKEKINVVDWLDENGDPVPGAFDYVKPEEDPGLNKNSKVEYVFSVREKKDVPIKSEPGDFVNSGFLINQNVLLKNVAGNLGVLLENQLVQDSVRIFQDDEEKKLYEASKSGAAYKAAVEAVTASSSTTDTLATVNKVVPVIDNTKKERFPRFRRNRFADIKKDESKPEETSEEKPTKSTEEVALERQAVSEILNEVQRGAARAKEHGALGWQKCPIPVTNKTFLRNTLVSTLREPYRPPSKRGRFHVGLKQEDDGKDHGKRQYDEDSHSSRSSRSRSHSSSRSCSSCSRSGSSFTGDERSESRDRQRRFPRGGGRGSWHRGHYQFYDEAWAAYNSHYGYGPWYGPEALPMFCGPEGWPMDPYAAMYYGDPQAWMEYENYYGPPNFNPRGAGRGFRGRGRGDFGRGRGGYEGDFRNYNQGFGGPCEFSQPHSRSGLSRSWSRDRSRSRSRINSVESRVRSRSHSLPGSHAHSHRRGHCRSLDRSLTSKSDDKMRSDTEMNEKKKKKKKKKKKHKKSKKSKHKQKDEEIKSGKTGEEGTTEACAEKDKHSNEQDGSKDRKQEGIDDLEKEDDASKQKKGKESYKHKNKGKSKRQLKEGEQTIAKTCFLSKVSGNVAEVNNTLVRKNERKVKDVDESSIPKMDRQAVHETKRLVDNSNKINERVVSSLNRGTKHKDSYSQNREKDDFDALIERDRRSESWDSRKRRLDDHRPENERSKFGVTERDRSHSHDSRKRMKMSEQSGRDGRVEIAAVIEEGRRWENQNSRAGVSGQIVKDRLGTADVSDRKATNMYRAGISGHRVKDRLGTPVSDRKSTNMDRKRVKDRLGKSDSSDRKNTSIDSRIGIIGLRVKERLGIADIADRSIDQDSRTGIRVTDRADEDPGVGIADILARRSESQNRKKRIADNINKKERGNINSRIEIARSESQKRRDNKCGKDVLKTKLGSDTTEAERSGGGIRKEGVIKDGGGGIRESSDSNDSMEGTRIDSNKRQRNIRYKVSGGSHIGERKFINNQEINKKDKHKNTEGRIIVRSQTVENDRISVGVCVGQGFLTSNRQIYDSSAGKISDTGQKGLQTDVKRHKKIVDIRSGTKDKSRSDSTGDSDENVNRKQAEKMTQKYRESQSGNEREFCQSKIIKGSMRNNKIISPDREMKGSSLEKLSERKHNSGTDRKAVKNSKCRDSQAHESQQHDREKYKESSKPEKLEHKKVVRLIRLNNENNTVVNNKDVMAESLEVTKGTHATVDAAHTKRHSNRIDETLSEATAIPEKKLKGAKRYRKLTHKQVDDKTEETQVVGEFVPERGDVFNKEKSKLKSGKKSKHGLQEGETNNDTKME